jgi:hypothetical protein
MAVVQRYQEQVDRLIDGKLQGLYVCPLSRYRVYNRSFGREMGSWAAGATYALNDIITPFSSAVAYHCTTPGVSGLTQPVWPQSGNVTDGGVTWTFGSGRSFVLTYPGQVQESARYWVAGLLMKAEYQQLDSNMNEAVQNYIDYAVTTLEEIRAMTDRLEGQTLRPDISAFMPQGVMPYIRPEPPRSV